MEYRYIVVALTLLPNAALLSWIAISLRSTAEQIELTDRTHGGAKDSAADSCVALRRSLEFNI